MNETKEDWELLGAYARENSEEAFRTLVERHAGLVYHAALRQLGNPHAAEETAQAVFIALARKAAKLNRGAPLSAWLFQATRFAVANRARGDARRARREKEAAVLETTVATAEEESATERIASALDEALDRLATTDRRVLLIRYLEGKSHRELAGLLGLTEEAAKKRVARALDRLRIVLARQGTLVAPAILLAALSCSAQAAPSGVIASALATSASGTGATGGPAAAATAKAITNWSARVQLKRIVLRGFAWLGGVAGVTALLLAATYAPNPKPFAPEPKFATPAQVIPSMMLALRAGDAVAYTDCFAFLSRADTGSRAALATLPAAAAKLNRALAAKFGTAAARAAFAKLPVGFEPRELMIDRGPHGISASASASEGVGGRGASLVRTNRKWSVSRVRGKWDFEITGEWKTTITGFFHRPSGPGFDAFCAALVQVMNTTATEVALNEFDTAEEAVAAVNRRATARGNTRFDKD
jgi:RNA polymerase sigma factor (sigma-70 family)